MILKVGPVVRRRHGIAELPRVIGLTVTHGNCKVNTVLTIAVLGTVYVADR